MTEAQPADSDQGARKTAGLVRGVPSRRWGLIVGGVLLGLVLLVVGVYGWRAFTVRNLERQIAAQRSEMTEASRQALKLQARDMLRLAARPLAWAVRSEVLKGNLGQVDDYLRQFVREPGVRSLLLIGKDGRIALASDRKLETQEAGGLVSKTVREATEVVFEESADSIRMAVPVMGFDDRLGILVVDYSPPVPAEAGASPATGAAATARP